MFTKILFPVDLSDNSARMVPYIKEMADRFSAEIHLLFVARRLQHFESIYVPSVSVRQFQDEIVKGATKKLAEFAQTHFETSECRKAVLAGDPASQILKYAQQNNVGLIIFSTHGRKGMDKILLGSVADYIIKNSPIPVLTVNLFKHQSLGTMQS